MPDRHLPPLNALSISNIISNERYVPNSTSIETISSIDATASASNGENLLVFKSPAPKFNQSTMTTKFRMKKKRSGSNDDPTSPTASTDEPDQLVSNPDCDQDGNSKNSCTRCRRLKKKCNKAIPECQNCGRSGEVCIYIPRKARKVSISSTPNQYVEKQKIEQEIPTPPTTISTPPIEVAVPPATDNFIPNLVYSSAPIDALQSANLTNQQLHTLNMPASLEGSSSRSSSILSTPFLANNLHTRTVLLSTVGIKLTNLSNSHNLPAAADNINNTLALPFIEAYFKHNHRAYPFIHEQDFMYIFDDLDFQRLDDYSSQFKFELFMIMAIGCTSLERANLLSREKDCKISETFVNKALTYIEGNLTGKNLDNVRSLLLLGLYAYFDPSEFSSWEIASKLVRQSISLGLNRKLTVKQESKMSKVDIEMRYRTFWSVYIMDRMISVSLGRPVGIRDEDINIPLPSKLPGENDSVEITKLFIRLRRIEGQVLCKVHSLNAGNISSEAKTEVFSELRDEIEAWYRSAREKQRTYANTTYGNSTNLFSFHGSFSWYSARYYHLLMLLYVPSYLEPSPSQQHLEILGKACLQSLSSTYNLFTSHLLPLNWITLYRFLTVCTSILHCLCKWSIDLIDSKNEIYYCIEILEAFGTDWVVAKKCAQVFKTIDNKMLEISLGATKSKDLKMDRLLNELLGASSAYHEILNDNSVDLFDTAFIKLSKNNYDGFTIGEGS